VSVVTTCVDDQKQLWVQAVVVMSGKDEESDINICWVKQTVTQMYGGTYQSRHWFPMAVLLQRSQD